MKQLKNICRCGHHKNGHITWQWYTVTVFDKKKCIGQTYTNEDGYDETVACACKNYIPSDNLEYLELKHERRI